ncbi:MAG: thiamine diphosphokinase [Eubacteriales bacterium]
MGICHLIGAMPATIKPQLKKGDILVAVDGGYQQILDWGLEPDIILGDFDSLGYVPKGENILSLPVRKDETDMEYAMNLGIKEGFSSFMLQGALGGRLDHSYANLQLLHRLSLEGKNAVCLGAGENAMILTEGTLRFPSHFTGYLSLFALGKEAKGIDLKHLSYSGENLTLSPTVPMGVSNEFLLGESAEIMVKDGSLLVLWRGVWDYESYCLLAEKTLQN